MKCFVVMNNSLTVSHVSCSTCTLLLLSLQLKALDPNHPEGNVLEAKSMNDVYLNATYHMENFAEDMLEPYKNYIMKLAKAAKAKQPNWKKDKVINVDVKDFQPPLWTVEWDGVYCCEEVEKCGIAFVMILFLVG